MFRYAIQPQTVGEVIKDSFRLYRQSFMAVLPFSLFLVVVSSLPVFVQLILGYTSSPVPANLGQLRMGFPSFLLLIEGLISPIFVAGLIAKIHQFGQKEGDMPMLTLFMMLIKQHFFKILIAFVLSTVLISAGFFLMIFPGVFLTVMLIFSTPLIIIDQVSALGAIRGSWKLVWGNWWVTALALLVPVMAFLFSMAFAATVAKDNQIVLLLLNGVVMLILMPLFYSTVLVQFNTLKLRKGTQI